MFPICKVALVGSAGVGKSQLAIQFLRNNFEAEYDPTLENAFRKKVMVDDELCILELFGTGTGDYLGVRDHYLRAAQGFLLVFSESNPSSLQDIENYREQICRVKNCMSPPMVLVENRSSMEKGNNERAKQMAETYGVPFLVASANFGLNINEAFYTLIREIQKKEAPVDAESCFEIVQDVFRRGCQMANNLFNSRQTETENPTPTVTSQDSSVCGLLLRHSRKMKNSTKNVDVLTGDL